MKYTILDGNPPRLAATVEEHLGKGWLCLGAPTFLPEPQGTILAFQAMILPEPGDTELSAAKEPKEKSGRR